MQSLLPAITLTLTDSLVLSFLVVEYKVFAVAGRVDRQIVINKKMKMQTTFNSDAGKRH